MDETSFLPKDEAHELLGVDLSPVIERLIEYSRKFGDAKRVESFFKDEDRTALNLDPIQNEKAETLYASIQSDSQKTLELTGLALVSGAGGVGFVEGREKESWEEKAEYTELYLAIADGQKFLKYLKTLDSQTVTESQIKSIFTVMSDQLSRIITHTHEISESGEISSLSSLSVDDSFLEFYKIRTELVTELERLVPKDTKTSEFLHQQILGIREVIDATEHRCLKETMDVYNLGMLYSPERGQVSIGATSPSYMKNFSSFMFETDEKAYRTGIMGVLGELAIKKNMSFLFDKVKQNMISTLDEYIKRHEDVLKKQSDMQTKEREERALQTTRNIRDEVSAIHYENS